MNDSAHWEVQYARFFNFPLSLSSTPTSSFLRPIFASKKQRLKGTWLSSSSSNVSVDILFYNQTLSQPTLVVSLNERIYEEHYISKLNFTWPKGSDVSECSLRESRVIFASYRDDMGQIQKFALRYASSTESRKFMELLKCLKEGRDCSRGMPRCVFTGGIDEEHSPLRQPSINHEHGLNSCLEEAVQDHAVGGTDVALPQSYSALLADCCTETDIGVSQAPTEANLKRFLKEKRLADNFLDLMDMMDSVIIGLGGGLAM
ncbi:hypothetical protein BVRB_5g117770 [Beta vulgaris subsp. vulgaris]|uniref:protein POOR HOMOLOGOUS SYNAPSIS 1 n=1 Tax=Beta vulgaris subsp. vulgaris TaxID=3555 RepID=UPI0005400667|nr:protein POOR HOMOLOGOUS SYNAPSIS 1 [Beta vulgaris subsp. vulgaris]KMT10661.1 hypothetical protein BVRB_5g117770 [Beta vulgaris subsp. vulgaris]